MLLGVVSDTHGHTANARAAIRMLESLEVEAVLHCGDVGSEEIPPLFAPWPTHFVLGNVDHDPESIEQAIEGHPNLHFHGRFADLSLDGRRIALIHSDDAKRFHQTINSGDYDLVCYGHTHIARQETFGRTLVLNPGALYRANPHSLAIVDLAKLEATIIPL